MFGFKDAINATKALEERMKKLEFIVNNPPKYKVGDLILDKKHKPVKVVVSVEMVQKLIYRAGGLVISLQWQYKAIRTNAVEENLPQIID